MAMSPTWSKRLRTALILVLALVVVAGVAGWYKLSRTVPQVLDNDSAETRFKYASLGAEADRGIPYWIWLVLPRVFPDFLPGAGGYGSLGFAWEPGQEMPVGFAKKTVGFPRVTNNCAVCHVTRYRTAEDAPRHFVTGGPAHTAQLQEYARYLTRCADDPRFNPDILLDEISQVYGLSFLDKKLYSHVIIPGTKRALQKLKAQLAWMDQAGYPAWGPGRDDAQSLKKHVLAAKAPDDTPAPVDFPSVWNLKIRKGPGLVLGWSGDEPTVGALLSEAAGALGAPHGAALQKELDGIEGFLTTLSPPPFPPEFPVDAKRAAAGAPLYETHCASCHEPGREKTSKVVPIAEIGTDHTPKSPGYVSPPLDGVWLRAPYLHNGSVPNMWELLQPAEKRSPSFYRGYDVYDPETVGFVCQGPEAARAGFKFDTAQRGNGNGGHLYGTTLPDPDKRALIEYLKTK